MTSSPPAAATQVNPIVRENALEGTKGWWGKHAPAHTIEAYTSQCSVLPGEDGPSCTSPHGPRRAIASRSFASAGTAGEALV